MRKHALLVRPDDDLQSASVEQRVETPLGEPGRQADEDRHGTIPLGALLRILGTDNMHIVIAAEVVEPDTYVPEIILGYVESGQ
jgi:hypothetical protein